jgi:hypothetical protein
MPILHYHFFSSALKVSILLWLGCISLQIEYRYLPIFEHFISNLTPIASSSSMFFHVSTNIGYITSGVDVSSSADP